MCFHSNDPTWQKHSQSHEKPPFLPPPPLYSPVNKEKTSVLSLFPKKPVLPKFLKSVVSIDIDKFDFWSEKMICTSINSGLKFQKVLFNSEYPDKDSNVSKKHQ